MRTWIIALFAMLLAGCVALGEKSREAAFNDISLLYAKTVEWSQFDNLGAFVKFTPDNPRPDPKRYHGIKVTDYQPGPGQGLADYKTVVRRAQIHYIESSRMSAQVLTVEEVWTYSEEDGRWLLSSGWPKF